MQGLFDFPDAVVSTLGPDPDWAEEWAEDPYRYTLTPRPWDPRLPVLAMVGLNPSVASTLDVAGTPEQHARKNGPDRTVSKFMAFARRDGFGGVMIANMYALRSTHPSDLRKHPDPIGPRNWEALELVRATTDHIVACWGADWMVERRPEHERAVLAALGKVRCFGVTSGEFPLHPLYLPNTTRIVPYTPRRGG